MRCSNCAHRVGSVMKDFTSAAYIICHMVCHQSSLFNFHPSPSLSPSPSPSPIPILIPIPIPIPISPASPSPSPSPSRPSHHQYRILMLIILYAIAKDMWSIHIATMSSLSRGCLHANYDSFFKRTTFFTSSSYYRRDHFKRHHTIIIIINNLSINHEGYCPTTVITTHLAIIGHSKAKQCR